MRTFMKGVLVGVGIGLLVAPMRGEEMRRLLSERFTEWRNSLPPDSPVNKYVQEISERANYTKEHWRDYAQQAASKAKDTGTNLSQKAQQSMQDVASKAKQTSQDVAHKAKQTSQDMASKAKQTVNFSRADGTATRVIPETDEQY